MIEIVNILDKLLNFKNKKLFRIQNENGVKKITLASGVGKFLSICKILFLKISKGFRTCNYDITTL